MVGIYKIENLINHKCYIGQSTHIEKRWSNEIAASKNLNDKAYNYPLQCAFRKYGEDNFSFTILEECSIKSLNIKERYWISYYDSFFNGYNQTLGGDGGSYNTPKEKIIGIINDLKTTNLYHREIAEKWHISIEMVQGINTGRYWLMDNENYPLQKNHKEKSKHIINGIIITPNKKYYCIECGKEISKGAFRCLKCSQKNQRKVERPNKEELEKYLFSINGNFTEAGKFYGITDNTIRKWCKSYNLPTHSLDYKPKLKIQEKQSIKEKAVQQFDLNDNLLAIFPSIMEAARSLGKPDGNTHISAVCKGKRKTAYGYKWKYKE